VTSYRDGLSRNLHVRKECAVSNSSITTSSVSTAAVVSKDVAFSETNKETGLSRGFIIVFRKKWREVAMATPPVNPKQSKKHRTPIIGVRNSSLVTISKRVKTKSLLSRGVFFSNITSRYIEEIFETTAQTFLFSLYKTKYNTCASFHISVHEDVFPLINNTSLWPQGALIAPFHGKLSADQIYSSENCNSNRSHSPGVCDPPVSPSVTSDSSDGAPGRGTTAPA
jgi:hypothetical protein